MLLSTLWKKFQEVGGGNMSALIAFGVACAFLRLHSEFVLGTGFCVVDFGVETDIYEMFCYSATSVYW
jgi:hypothetical protein